MNKLKQLFDYQKYEGNEKLSKIITETESRYMGVTALDDSSLEMVNAGIFKATPSNKDKKNDPLKGPSMRC